MVPSTITYSKSASRPRRSDRTRRPWPIGESAESSSSRKPREGRATAPRPAQSREPLRRKTGCPPPSGPHPQLFPEQAARSAPIDHHAGLDGPRSPPSGNLETNFDGIENALSFLNVNTPYPPPLTGMWQDLPGPPHSAPQDDPAP